MEMKMWSLREILFRSKISTFPTITIWQINQDIKKVDVSKKTEEKALKQVDVSIQKAEITRTVEAKIIKNSKGTNITDDIKVVKKDDIAKNDINMEAKATKKATVTKEAEKNKLTEVIDKDEVLKEAEVTKEAGVVI